MRQVLKQAKITDFFSIIVSIDIQIIGNSFTKYISFLHNKFYPL